MKYQVIAKLDEIKYKSCQDMDPKLWPRLKDKVYILNTWPTKEWAEWSAAGHREYQHSNLDTNTVEVIEIEDDAN
jgi:hypothetical protein